MQYIQILGFWGDIGKEIGNVALKILALPFMLVFLLLDGIVYTLVAYSYKLFELMSRLNFASLKAWVGPVMDRVQALIIVIIFFMLGYALINYLVNPDKINDKKVGGAAMIKNIAIVAVLLIVYSYAFTLLNETTFLLIGAPEGYEYQELNTLFGVENDGSPGLISNLIFGGVSEEENETDFGVALGVNTLHIFLHDRYEDDASILSEVYNTAIESGEGNLLPVTAAVTEINILSSSENGKVEYKFPIISTAVGLYLVYTLVSIAIELAIRAFKLIILEIVAPIAIITIVKDGFQSKVWTNWYKLVGKTFLDCFLRVGAVYFVVAFINTAWNRIGELFDYNYDSTQGFTSFLLLILVVAAGFKFAKDLPKFIDSIFGSHLADANKNGFGNFMRGMLGGIAGGALGFAGGLSAAKANGLSAPAAAWNALKGGATGASAGSKGKKVAENIKNIKDNNGKVRQNAENMKSRGGTLRSNMGYTWRETTGKNYSGQKQVQGQIKAENSRFETRQRQIQADVQQHQTAMENAQHIIDERTRAMATQDYTYTTSNGSQIKMKMDSKFVQNYVAANEDVRTAKGKLEVAQQQLKVDIEQNGGANAAQYQKIIRDAEVEVAQAEYRATEDAKNIIISNEGQAVQDAKQAILDERAEITRLNAEAEDNRRINDERIKGTIDPATGKRRKDGLNDKLKHFGGKSGE